jgi:ankyrin repeat protein
MLLQLGANPDQANREGWTALMEAVDKAQTDIVEALIGAGAGLEEKDARDGKTALMVAARGNDAPLVAMLLDAGANIAAGADGSALTALHYALQSRRDNVSDGPRQAAIAIITELLAAGADAGQPANDGWTPLMSAVLSDNIDRVRLILDAGADLHPQDETGRTVLTIAASRGQIELVTLLIDRGAASAEDVLDRETIDGEVAAGVASENLEIVQILVDAGLPLQAENRSGRHPLTLAAGSGFDEIVDYLLANGFLPDLRNSSDGSTAIMWAANAGHKEIVQALLDAGSNPLLKGNDGWTALEAAEMAGHDDIAVLLKDGA